MKSTVTSISPRHNSAAQFFFVLGSLMLVVVCLYFAREVLIPLVAAFLLTFVLTPVVVYLQGRGLGRLLAAAVVFVMVLLIVVGIFLAIINQFNSLAGELPKYKDQILTKIDSIRHFGQGSLPDTFLGLLRDVSKAVMGGVQATDQANAPLPVVLESSSLPFYGSVMGSTLEVALNGGLVLLLAFFMLLNRENLRNRLIRLIGPDHLSKTINALDDSSTRVSKYLLMQLLVNLSFGVTLGTGLLLIGVPFAFIWGFSGTFLRYIPYLGPVLASIFPLAISWAVFPDWLPFFLVAGLFIGLEFSCSNFLEPYLYGRSIGVSEVALLTMAVFWAWLWGPLGLVLATPLTAIMVVLGRHFPQLRVISMLLGDEAALEPPRAFFQRLLAGDKREANDIVVKYLKDNRPGDVYEDLFVPTVVNFKRERKRGAVSHEVEDAGLQIAQEILTDAVFPKEAPDVPADEPKSFDVSARLRVYGLAFDAGEELILEMFKKTLDPRKYDFSILPAEMLLSEKLQKTEQDRPAWIVMGASRRSARKRVILKKINGENTSLGVIVAIWGAATFAPALMKRWQNAGATYVETNFGNITSRLNEARQILPVT